MKKLLLATMLTVSMLFVSSVNAETGTVSSVAIMVDGNVQVAIDDSGVIKYAILVGVDAEMIKQMLAVALTAKSSGATVNVGFGGGGWNRITLL